MRKSTRKSLALALGVAAGLGCTQGEIERGPAGTGAAGTSAPGAAGTSAPGAAGTSASGAAGTSASGAAGTSAPGAAGTSASGAAGTSASGAAGTSASGAAGTSGSAGTSGAAGQGSDGGAKPDAAATTDAAVPTAKFSFFATSLKALQDLSKNPQGFGGNLTFGEAGPGAGLRGADKICAAIAERSMKGAGGKPWRAFLSAAMGEDGKQINAIDRIGDGPWYDRLGRTLALTKADLLFDRPRGADPVIANDFPNEDGVPNHAPDPGAGQVDNHDFLTGSTNMGTLFNATGTCKDWTGATGTEGKPRCGHSWPRMGSGVNWMSALNESGCSPGVSLVEMGGPKANSTTVGSGGGYGGFYCFSLTP